MFGSVSHFLFSFTVPPRAHSSAGTKTFPWGFSAQRVDHATTLDESESSFLCQLTQPFLLISSRYVLQMIYTNRKRRKLVN